MHGILSALSGVLTVDTPYTPADLATDLAAGTATVLPWVGAGVGGGIVLLFAFMGIRKGFAFFRSIGR